MMPMMMMRANFYTRRREGKLIGVPIDAAYHEGLSAECVKETMVRPITTTLRFSNSIEF